MFIALFGVTLHIIEARGMLEESFGDTGGFGDEETDETVLSIGDYDYITTDDIDAYMLVGTDNGGEDFGEGFNGEFADFITVMVIDNTTEKYGFYHIDRNTMVEINIPDKDGKLGDNYFEEQICIAHWYGKTAEERNRNLEHYVSELLGGLEIGGCYVLKMGDTDKVNDAIGGVTVDIEEDMTAVDPKFVKGAKVHLDNGQAEKFLRARSALSDNSNAGRMKRQQQYMRNAYNMLIGQLRENPEYINELYTQLEPVIQTEGNVKLSRLTKQLSEYTGQGILTFSGKSRTADTLGDGVEHEEFYADSSSIVSNLKKVIDMTKYE